jgi:hypothetical protein
MLSNSVTRLGKISPFRLLFTQPISTQRSSFNPRFVSEGFKTKSSLMWMFWAFKIKL